jgi:hypothetical protein
LAKEQNLEDTVDPFVDLFLCSQYNKVIAVASYKDDVGIADDKNNNV